MFNTKSHANEFFEVLVDRSEGIEWQLIDKALVHKSCVEQVLIGDVIDLSNEVLRDFFPDRPFERIYATRAFPNLQCAFCFDHPLDHYPLMMLIEIGRQLGTAVSHRFYDVPLRGYTGIGDAVSIEFKQFIELDKPLYVVCADSAFQDRKSTRHRSTEMSFLQEGIECACGNGSVTVVNHSLYRRLRNGSRAEILNRPAGDIGEIFTNRDLASCFERGASLSPGRYGTVEHSSIA